MSSTQQSAALSYLVKEVVSEVDDASKHVQDQNVDIVVDRGLFTVVLHRKDAVHRDSHRSAEVLHLSIQQN